MFETWARLDFLVGQHYYSLGEILPFRMRERSLVTARSILGTGREAFFYMTIWIMWFHVMVDSIADMQR